MPSIEQVKRDRRRCYDFVQYWDREMARKATDALHSSSFQGRRLVVKLTSFGWSQRRYHIGHVKAIRAAMSGMHKATHNQPQRSGMAKLFSGNQGSSLIHSQVGGSYYAEVV